MKITVITGTVRPGNYTQKAVQLSMSKLRSLSEREAGNAIHYIDLADYHLDMPGYTGDSIDKKNAESLRIALRKSDGILLGTPEYNGSFPAALKLMIENLGYPSALSQKPVALLGVASGTIGAIKSLEHLRSVLCHIGAIVLPRVVSVPEVQKVFLESGVCKDSQIKKRIEELSIDLYNFTKSVIPCGAEVDEQIVRG